MTSTRYLTPAETAKLVRSSLKANFKSQKFSVRAKSYSGGGSIHVTWTDGPTEAEVTPIVNQYSGSNVDGSIDLKYGRTSYLRSDGAVYTHHDPGTVGTHGTHEGADNRNLEALMPEDVEVVQFGADFVFVERRISDRDAKISEAAKWIYQNCDTTGEGWNPNMDYFGSYPVAIVAQAMVKSQAVGDGWATTFSNWARV